MSIVKIVLRPDSERRIAASSRTGASAATLSPSPPYTAIGTIPSRRARRASFLPRPSRFVARTVISLCSAMTAPLYKRTATGVIADLQLPIADFRKLKLRDPYNRQLALGNRNLRSLD